MKDHISIVIPTHDRLEDLKRAVDSVFKQTYQPNEIIVIDDGSNPKVTVDCFGAIEKGVKLSLLRNEVPKGASYARNMGIAEATGEYIVFLDDDDELMPKKLELILRNFIRTKADIIYHPAIVKYTKENLSYVTNPLDRVSFIDCLVGNQIGGTSMVSVKRDILLNAGGFDTNLPALEDYELWIRLARLGAVFYKIKEPLVSYRVTTGKDYMSASMEKFICAKKIIHSKYSNEYLSLSKNNKKKIEEANKKHKAYRFLLSGKKTTACRLYLSAFKERFKIELLLASFFSFFGVRALVLCQKIKNRA